VPDVAAHAYAWKTFFWNPYPGPSLGLPFGGTSASTPSWAALIALINQAVGLNQGFLNPVIDLRLGPQSALNDITSGNNGPDYQAGPGWDPCTGWGSPNGTLMCSMLGPPAVNSVVPPTGLLAGGTQVTISGTGLEGVTSVSFGNTSAFFDPSDSSNLVIDTQITVVSPMALAPGIVDVIVTTAVGSPAATLQDQFSYVAPVPSVASVVSNSGVVGDVVTITGGTSVPDPGGANQFTYQ
jgi:hypothetical protein